MAKYRFYKNGKLLGEREAPIDKRLDAKRWCLRKADRSVTIEIDGRIQFRYPNNGFAARVELTRREAAVWAMDDAIARHRNQQEVFAGL